MLPYVSLLHRHSPATPAQHSFPTRRSSDLVKNRLHLDFAPHTSTDREAEVSRLLELGATQVDVGQPPEATWTVLTDPERSEEHTSELQSRGHLVCRLLLERKNI